MTTYTLLCMAILTTSENARAKKKNSSKNVFPCTYILGFIYGIIFNEKKFLARARILFLLEQEILKFNFFYFFKSF
jgi:uncharacterized membrane protein YadS